MCEPREEFQPCNDRLRVEDLFKGIHPALLKLAEWNRQITVFTTLTIDDQAKLMHASWCEHYTMKVVNLDLETDAEDARELGGVRYVAWRDNPLAPFEYGSCRNSLFKSHHLVQSGYAFP